MQKSTTSCGCKQPEICKDILYEIRHNESLEKIRIEFSRLQNRCISETITATELPKRIQKDSVVGQCGAYQSASRLVHTANKLTVEVTHEVEKDAISTFIRSGIFNYGIDLFYGSVQQNLDVLIRLQEAALKESQFMGFTIPLSIYLKLSPRHHYTGALRSRKDSFHLKRHSRVVLTTNRKYASRCCHSIIYVNAKFLLFYIRKCHVICVGNEVQLQVIDTSHDHIVCLVTVPGRVTARMAVRFPPEFQWAQLRVSAEELEDITFAMGTNINVLVTHSPGFPELLEQMRETLKEFKCDSFYVFTRVTLEYLSDPEDNKWIGKDFDGFILDCSQIPPQNKIITLSSTVRRFIHKVWCRRKPLYLHGCWSVCVYSSDYLYAFYYPDKYVLPCNSDFLHLFEAVFNRFAPQKCTDKHYHDGSLTGSNTIARSITAASFDFRADVIVLASISGQMAEKIAHFRPKTPIIAVTSVASTVNYTCMHHNVWMLFFDSNLREGGEVISHKKDTHQKLVYGVRFAELKQLININSTIILVFRKFVSYGYTDKFVVMKFNEDYVETIRIAILAQ